MKKLLGKLGDGPINYFSDLFIAAMVILWIADNIYESIIATAVTLSSIVISLQTQTSCYEVSMWSSIGQNIAVPLGAGGALWMVKCGVQHAIANRAGHECDYDFPKVDADGEENGNEESESNVEPAVTENPEIPDEESTMSQSAAEENGGKIQ